MNDAAAKVIDTSKAHLADDVTENPVRYFDNPLDSFRQGVVLDMRVKLAIDLLTHSPMFTNVEGLSTKQVTTLALDVATELVAEADRRGLLEDLDSPAAMARMKEHIKRSVEFQMAQASETRRAQEQAVHVGSAVRSALRPN